MEVVLLMVGGDHVMARLVLLLLLLFIVVVLTLATSGVGAGSDLL